MDDKKIYLAGSFSTGRVRGRCWGWYDTFDEAVARMRRDRLFFEGGHYDLGLVEVYPYGDALPLEERWWFRPVYDEGAGTHSDVVACDEPDCARRIVGFLM